jgi:hypothetical protein
VANNTYHILIKENTGLTAWRQENEHGDISDFSASVYVRRVSPASQSDGCLIVRSSLSPDGGAYYRFCIVGDGRQTYADFVSGGAIQTTLLAFQDRPASNDLGLWNRLELMVRGDHFWFFVNGVLVGEATHTGPLLGSIGVKVGAYDNGAAEFEFLNLVVRSVSGP